MSDLQINKTFTSNPFVDYLLYYTKILAFGSVIKDDDEAEKNETEASMMAGDILISCVENNVIFELFTYSREELIAVGITDPFQIKRCIENKNNIPLNKRDAITQVARQDYINNYEELNPYYRTICGLPPINDYGIPIRDYEYHFVDSINPWNVTYIHELNHDAIIYLEQKGILDQIRQDYPDARYLDFITCDINPYKARKAYEYQLLYYPDADKDVVQEKFVRKYNENRLYVLTTFYSEGLKLTSRYYTNFIGILIMIMTMTDMLSELQEHIVKKDLLDKRCIQYIFDMYGIPYYNSIPIKYQYRMCKNINQLIRYKSSAQGMLNLIDLFGAEDIEIFKYFILRDRNADKWGDIAYNQIATTVIKPNNIINHDESLHPGTFNNGTILDIPFPTNDFLELGNKLVVWANNTLLEEGVDYEITIENKLKLRKRVNDVRFDFYYNNLSDKDNVNKENGLYIKCDDIRIINNRTFSFKPPYKGYITDGNDLIVSLGGAILGPEQYTVNTYNNTITLDNSFDLNTYSNGRNITVLYLYGNKIVTKYLKRYVTATVNNQTSFNIPEPFINYAKNGNAFFITYRNTFIQNNRYTINTQNSTITFTDITVPQGIQVVFYFIYAEATIYQEINLEKREVQLTVEEDYQTIFSLIDENGQSLFPFEKYLATPYKVYLKVRNYSHMLDQDYYDVYGNSLVLRDTTLCLRKGENITIIFVYGPHETMASLKTDKRYVYASENYQTEFDIDIPEDNYFSELNGAVIVDIYGNYLEPTDYTISETNRTLTITNLDKTPAAGQKINLTFIRNIVSENNIVISQQYPTIGSTYNDKGVIKPRFNISIPFAGYFESGQNILVFHNTTLISPTRVHYKVDDSTETTVHFIYLDDNPNEYQNSDSVIIMFIYNGWYVRQLDENIEDLEVNCAIDEIIDDDLIFSIPFPFSKYLENGWFLYITDEDGIVIYRSNNDETGIDDTEYPCEIIDNALTFVDASVIPEYNRLIFHFIHFNSPNYITIEYEEDYENNYNLKFIGIPLTEDFFTKEIMKKINVLPYETATLEDKFWDGVSYDSNTNDLHNKVKLDILKKKFNYERTKYFGINYVINISEMAFRISYFYNMLFDKYFIENRLNVKVPSIAPYKEFNIANLFCYMTSLSYLFSGVQDYILNNFSTLLFIKGFNFGSDLETLKKWLKKNFRYLEDYPVWDFINNDNIDTRIIDGETISDGSGQIKDMESFVKIFCNNRDIYDVIVKSIYKSQDYDIFSIWKKIYDTMMTIEYNDAFYRVTLTNEGINTLAYDEDMDIEHPAHVAGDEIVARSFKELLFYRDRELYNDIIYIENIGDEIRRSDIIIERIADVVYILEEWMDSEEFHNIYDSFPGVSGDSLVSYLFTIINFFKSYKVVLRSKGDFIVFTADDPMLNTIKIIDVKDMNLSLEKPEYMNILDTIDTGIYLYKDDDIKIKDKATFESIVTSSISDKFLPLPEDYPYKTNNISKIKVKRTTHQYITIFTDKGEIFTTDVSSGIISAIDKEDHSIIGMITFFNPYINDSDVIFPHMVNKLITNDDLNGSSTTQFIVLDHGFPESLRSDFKTKIMAGDIDYQHVLIRDSHPDNEYIEFEVEYGTEFYVYITPDLGWYAGILNIRYGKVFDDDVYVEATDATTIMRELYIYQTPHQTITLVNTMGEEISESTNVPYGSVFYPNITSDEGYNPGQLQVVPESSIVGASIVIDKTTSVSATQAIIKTFTVFIEAFEHENIVLTINGGTIFVETGNTRELINIPYFTEYTIDVYSEVNYTPGVLNIPKTGRFTSAIQQSAGYIYIAAEPATLNTYTITVRQTPHQTITVTYNGISYSENGSFVVQINTIIECSIRSEDGYIAGTLNITERIVNEDLIITATDAVEASMLLITISSGNNQFITVVYNGEEYIEDFYVPFGSAYTSYLTPYQGFTTDAEIINFRSDELRNNVVVYASKDATPNINTITLINPDPIHQSLRVYVNGDQEEENIKTETFNLESGNTISAELISIDPDYIVGNLNINGIIRVISDVNVIATAPTNINNIFVTVDTIENQDIEVEYNNIVYHSGDTFVAQALTTAYIEIIPDEGYQYTHSDFVPAYTFERNGLPVLITADPPIFKTCNIFIEQKPHQLIYVTGTVRIYNEDNTYTEIDNYTTTDSETNFIYGTAFTVDIVSTDPEYEHGELNIVAGTVDDNIIITASDPTHIDS